MKMSAFFMFSMTFVQYKCTLLQLKEYNELLWPESNKRRPRITIAASMRGIQSDSTRPKAHNRNKNFGEQYWNAIRIVNWVNIRSCTSINKNSSRLDLGFCNVFVTILKMKSGWSWDTVRYPIHQTSVNRKVEIHTILYLKKSKHDI